MESISIQIADQLDVGLISLVAFAMNFRDILGFSVSPWEMVLRGTTVYWFLFLLFRFVLRRDTGSIGLADILVVVLIADAAQNAMAGEYHGVADGMLLIATIGGWNYWFDWMSYRFPWFARFAEPRTVLLIRHGTVFRENLARQLLTMDELTSQLREQGIEHISEVKKCYLETDGSISVIRYKSGDNQKRPDRRPPGA